MICVAHNERNDISGHLQRLGVPTTVMPLEYGDLVFEGNGEEGTAVIGVERKRLQDMINSMTDRRLAGRQLREMQKNYDYCFLVFEAMMRPGPGGEILEWGWVRNENGKGGGGGSRQGWRPAFGSADRQAVSYAQLSSFLHSLTLQSRSQATGEPLRLIRTASVEQTAAEVASLYRWFTEKTWGEHHSADAVYCGDLPKKGHRGGWAARHGHNPEFDRGGRVGTATNGTGPADPTTLWRMAAQLPGVDRRARAVARHFGTVLAMAVADEKEWRKVDGIGEKTAEAVVRAIREEGA